MIRMKKQECNSCGCKRVVMIKSIVFDQLNDVKYDFKWLCIPCLLKDLKVLEGKKLKITELMTCLEEK